MNRPCVSFTFPPKKVIVVSMNTSPQSGRVSGFSPKNLSFDRKFIIWGVYYLAIIGGGIKPSQRGGVLDPSSNKVNSAGKL
jgi:hypothetical protein